MKKYLDPNKLKLEFVKEEYRMINGAAGRIRKTWRIGEYSVCEYRSCDNPYETSLCITKNTDAPFGVPEIYDEYDPFAGTTTGFTIETKEYGALTPDKIEKLVAGYTYALTVVKILEDSLLRPLTDPVENSASRE